MSNPDYVLVVSSSDESDGDSIEFLELREHTQDILDNPQPQPPSTSIDSSDPAKPKKLGDAQCPICFDDITSAAATLCGHIFCLECIQQGIASSHARGQVDFHGEGLCPLCRKLINLKDVVILRVRELPFNYYDRVGLNKRTAKDKDPPK